MTGKAPAGALSKTLSCTKPQSRYSWPDANARDRSRAVAHSQQVLAAVRSALPAPYSRIYSAINASCLPFVHRVPGRHRLCFEKTVLTYLGSNTESGAVVGCGRNENVEKAAEAAARWLQSPPTTPEQEKEFMRWLTESPTHVREMLASVAWDDELRKFLESRSDDAGIQKLVAKSTGY